MFNGDSHVYRSDNRVQPRRPVTTQCTRLQRHQLPPRRRPRQHAAAGMAAPDDRSGGQRPREPYGVRPVQLGADDPAVIGRGPSQGPQAVAVSDTESTKSSCSWQRRWPPGSRSDRLAGQRGRQRRREPRPARRRHVVVERSQRRVRRGSDVIGVDVHRVGCRPRGLLRLDHIVEAERDRRSARGDAHRLRQVVLSVGITGQPREVRRRVRPERRQGALIRDD